MVPKLAQRVLLLSLALLCGCSMIHTTRWSEQLDSESDSPLAPLKPKSEQIVLDVVFVRMPLGDDEASDKIWNDVDEQALPSGVRRRLASNGFRVGVLSGELPEAVTTLLDRAAKPITPDQSPQAAGSDEDAGSTRYQMYLRPEQRAELVVSSIRQQFHALMWKEGRIEGQTFNNGQAQLALHASTTDDAQVQLELTPEVHHGSYQQRYVPGEAMFRLDSRRNRQVMEDLTIQAALASGQVLVLGSHRERQGSLGHCFFHDASANDQGERLLLLRLLESPRDPLFASGEED